MFSRYLEVIFIFAFGAKILGWENLERSGVEEAKKWRFSQVEDEITCILEW